MARLAAWSSAAVLLFGATAAAQAPPARPRLFVDIVAVTEFEDPAYPALSEGLGAAYSDAADSLVKFFAASLPSAQVKVWTGVAETSRAAVQGLLYEHLAKREDSVNLLFILTHGHQETFPASQIAERELFLAVIDSRLDDIRGTALPAAELLAAITHFPASSSTFVFIDACHSAAALNLSVTLNRSLWEAMGVNLMVLVSSGAYQKSFNALFTRALVEQWSTSGNECLDGQGRIARELSNRIQQKVGESTWRLLRQDITLVVPYSGGFCLDSLSRHGALALVRNPTGRAYRLRYRRSDGHGAEFEAALASRSMMPIKLDRVEYLLEALDPSSEHVLERHALNMAEEPVRPVSLGTPAAADLAVDARLLQESSVWAQRSGASPSVYEDLSLKAIGLLVKAGETAEANELQRTMLVKGVSDPVVRFVLPLVGERAVSAPVVAREAQVQKVDLPGVAIALGHAGQFAASARLCQSLLEAHGSANQELFECAYLGWVAAGQQGLAQNVRRDDGSAFKLCDECVQVASRGGGSGAGVKAVMDKVRQ
jgi:hypothetical protein